jgi:curli production assembly/transport component CsgG
VWGGSWWTAKWLAAVGCSLILAGCVQDPLPSENPQVVEEQPIALPPPPPRPLTVGVYNCIDTTGQRRPTQLAQELSTAVPLDCTPYLIEAVRSLQPGYITLVEREHVDDLLRERQLATLALNNATSHGGPPQKLNTLRVAEVLLIGQVVAYDRATRQAAGGLAVGGTGGTGTFVTDVVTFSLRAVAVQTGEILGETSVTKSITSLRVGGHVTQIFTASVVDFELGGAGNEPVGLALHAAVHTALGRLIRQGIHNGWWAG